MATANSLDREVVRKGSAWNLNRAGGKGKYFGAPSSGSRPSRKSDIARPERATSERQKPQTLCDRSDQVLRVVTPACSFCLSEGIRPLGKQGLRICTVSCSRREAKAPLKAAWRIPVYAPIVECPGLCLRCTLLGIRFAGVSAGRRLNVQQKMESLRVEGHCHDIVVGESGENAL